MTLKNQTPQVSAEKVTADTTSISSKSGKRQWSSISVLGLIQVIGFLPFVATFIAFAGSMHWLIDLFNHFRFQYLIILTVVAALLAFLKQRRLAAVYLIGAMVNLLTVLPLYWPTFVCADKAHPQLTLMHFNVNVGNRAYDDVAQYIVDSGSDIVLIQELHFRMDDRLREIPEYRMVISEPRYDSFGVAMLVRKDVSALAIEESVSSDITEGRAKVPAILAKLRWHDQPLALMSLHTLPPRSQSYAQARDTQLIEAGNWVNKQSDPVILIGDLNATPWSDGLRNLFGMTTLRNSQQGFGVHGTWPSDGGPIGKIPIDHCLISESIKVTDRYLGDSHGSDHLPLFVTLQMQDMR